MARLKPGNYPTTNRWSRNATNQMNGGRSGQYGGIINRQIPNSPGINPMRAMGVMGATGGSGAGGAVADPCPPGTSECPDGNCVPSGQACPGPADPKHIGGEKGKPGQLYGQGGGGATPIPGVSPLRKNFSGMGHEGGGIHAKQYYQRSRPPQRPAPALHRYKKP